MYNQRFNDSEVGAGKFSVIRKVNFLVVQIIVRYGEAFEERYLSIDDVICYDS